MKRLLFTLLLTSINLTCTAKKVETPEEREAKYAPYVLKNCPLQEYGDAIFSSQKAQDALFGPISYEQLPRVKKLLKEEAGLTLNDYGRKVVTHPALPGIIIKCGRQRNDRSKCDNISRVVESARMRAALKEAGVDDIVVPQKWLFHLPGTPEEFCDANYVVFAEKLDILITKDNHHLLWNLPLERAKKLLDYLIDMRYPDMSDHNIYFMRDKKTIAIVDTEEWNWSKNTNWCAKRFMTIVNPETVKEILEDEEFRTKYKLKDFETLYRELQEKK